MRVKKIFLIFLKSNKFLLFILNTLGLLYANVYASFELKGSSARIQAMGQAYVGLANTPDAIFINCSGLAQLGHTTFSFYYTQPFGMNELTYGSFAAIVPTHVATFATGITSFGNEFYREQSLMLAVNRSMKQKLYYGFNLHYMKLQIDGYGSDFSFEVDIGFLVKMTPKLNWGFFITNLNRATLGRSHDSLPQTLCTGLSISPANDLILNMDIYKDSMYPLELRCGIEYLLFHRVAFRSGFSTEPSQFCAGFGLLFSHFEAGYAVTTHQSLGLTHHFSLQVKFKSKQENAIHHKSGFKIEPVIITKLDINTAGIEQLQKIPGIGSILARRIIAYRTQIGKFNSLNELCHVKGISKAKLQSIEPYVTIVK